MKTYDKPDVSVSRWWWYEEGNSLYYLDDSGDLCYVSSIGTIHPAREERKARWLPAVPPTFPARQKAAVRFGTAKKDGVLVGIEWTQLNHQSATVTWLHNHEQRIMRLADLTDVEWFTPEYLEES